MEIILFIALWLLCNTWLSIILCQIDGGGVADNWFEIMCLAFASVLSPIVWLCILAIIRKIKKYLKNT